MTSEKELMDALRGMMRNRGHQLCFMRKRNSKTAIVWMICLNASVQEYGTRRFHAETVKNFEESFIQKSGSRFSGEIVHILCGKNCSL